MSLGKVGLIPPGEEIHTGTLIKPNNLNLTPEGEIDPDCPLDTDGIAPCRRFQPLVMFVGGANDPGSDVVLGDTFAPYNLKNEHIQDIGYGAWQTGASIKGLALHWMSQGQKIVLVGHSYGGDTVMDVSRELSEAGKEVELIVTLDPVSRFGPTSDQPKPSGVKKWLNIYVNYSKSKLGWANFVASIGGPWGYCNNADKNAFFEGSTGEEHAYADFMFNYYIADVKAVI